MPRGRQNAIELRLARFAWLARRAERSGVHVLDDGAGGVVSDTEVAGRFSADWADAFSHRGVDEERLALWQRRPQRSLVQPRRPRVLSWRGSSRLMPGSFARMAVFRLRATPSCWPASGRRMGVWVRKNNKCKKRKNSLRPLSLLSRGGIPTQRGRQSLWVPCLRTPACGGIPKGIPPKNKKCAQGSASDDISFIWRRLWPRS